jgi:uracil-DNA glycosylase
MAKMKGFCGNLRPPHGGKDNTKKEIFIMEKSIITDCSKYITNNRVAFVFSCPGQDEERYGRPCVGRTGDNLDKLIDELHRLNSEMFPNRGRYNYTIMNASDKVHYETLDKRTEPTDAEVLTPKNIERLSGELELSKAEIVIACGKKAKLAVNNIARNCRNFKIVCSEHLSPTNLNCHVMKKLRTANLDATIKRLAEKIIEDIKNK